MFCLKCAWFLHPGVYVQIYEYIFKKHIHFNTNDYIVLDRQRPRINHV